MTITKTIIALIAVVAFAPSAASAAALYGGGTASANAADISVGAGAGVGAEANDDGGTEHEGIGEPLDSADDDADSRGTNLSITASSQVKTDADLTLFGESIKTEDARVADVKAESEGEVSVDYYHPGRLFGIFPIQVKSETRAMLAEDGAAKVETHMPWWNFFVIGTDDTSTMIDESLSASTQFSTDLKMEADASARARLIEAIVKAHADASLAAQASANAEQQ